MAELKLGNIKPVGADNIVVESKYVKGGYTVVANETERNALKGNSGENIIQGSLCYCVADSKFYQYNGSTWVEADLGGGVTSYNDLTDKPTLFSGDYEDLTNKPIELNDSNYIVKDPDGNNRAEVNSSGIEITGNLELSGTISPTLKIIGTEGAGTLTVDQVKSRAFCRGEMANDPVIMTAGAVSDAAASQIIYVPGGLSTLSELTSNWANYEIVNKTMLGNPVKSIAIGSGDTNELLITYLNGSEETISVGAGSTADGVTIEEVETYLNDNSEEVDLASYFTKTDVDTLFNSIFEFDGTTLIIKDN